MTEVVLDASVVLKWFAAEQHGSFEARELAEALEDPSFDISEPDLQSVAGRRPFAGRLCPLGS